MNLKKPVNITEDSQINVWLTKMDNQMMFCLVTIFESSIKEIRGLEEDENSINQGRLKIIDSIQYQSCSWGCRRYGAPRFEIVLLAVGGEHLLKSKVRVELSGTSCA